LELWQQSQWYVKTWTLLLALIPGAIHTVPHIMEVMRPVWIIVETPGDLGKPVRKPPSLVRIDVAVTLEDAKLQADGGDPWMLGGGSQRLRKTMEKSRNGWSSCPPTIP